MCARARACVYVHVTVSLSCALGNRKRREKTKKKNNNNNEHDFFLVFSWKPRACTRSFTGVNKLSRDGHDEKLRDDDDDIYGVQLRAF